MSGTLDKKKVLFWLITCLITLAVLLIPTGEVYTLAVKKFCAITIFFIAALAFDILDAYVAGIGMPLFYVLFGVCAYSAAFSGWTSSTTMLIMTSFIFANILDRIGLLKRLGLTLILKLGGSFSRTMWALLIAGVVITFITFCNCAIINVALGYALYRSFNLKPTDREAVAVLLVTIVSSCTAQMFSYNAFLVSVLSNSTASIIEDFNLPWYSILLNNLPSILFVVLFVWGVLKWTRSGKNSRVVDVSASKAYCEKEYAALGTMTIAEKKAVVVLILIMIMIYLFTQPLHGLDVAYAFMLGTAILFLPGVNVGDNQDFVRAPWKTVFLVFAFLGIGAAANATGFTAILSRFLTPLISQAGMTGSVYVTYFFGIIANLVLSPFAMCSMLTLPISQYCADLGYSVLPHILALYQSCDVIFLPYE